jgi:hypothetical protein
VTGDADRPLLSDPPLVYPAREAADRWVVVAPPPVHAAGPALKTFSGPNALNHALRYAYEEFGSARFFPFAWGK